MENLKNSNQSCGCGDGCCMPKNKSRLWKMLIFCFILLSAGTIIAAKIAGKNEAMTEKCCEAKENASCCSSAVSFKEASGNEQSGIAPCCQQTVACNETTSAPSEPDKK